jgi:hypothetical protein
MVASYPMISPMVPFTQTTPHNYPLGHHSHLFVTGKGQKLLKKKFWHSYLCNLLFYLKHQFMGQWMVSIYSKILPSLPFTLTTPYSYPMSHHVDSFVTRNRQKLFKNKYLTFLPPLLPILLITSFHGTIDGLQLTYDITYGALYTDNPV